MKILLFEWLNSGGLWLDGHSPSGDCPIQYQGLQMFNAVAADLIAAGSQVVGLVDSRLAGEVAEHDQLIKHEVNASIDLPSLLLSLARESDAVLVIAPETDSTLSGCLSWLDSVSHKLLNPDAKFTQLASYKSDLFEYLKSNGFEQFPDGINFQSFLDQVNESDRSAWNLAFGVPAVLKPDCGAGSEEVGLVSDWVGWNSNLSRPRDQYRLEAFVPGTAVSVSVLCGGDQCDVLSPTIQLFEESDTDGSSGKKCVVGGHYLGAEFPIDEDVSRRAVELACAVLKSLPKTRGYIGMDLVISDSENQEDDRLIEINPRLTMSYSRLSQIYRTTTNWGTGQSTNQIHTRNLAMEMVERSLEPATDSEVICTFREPSP